MTKTLESDIMGLNISFHLIRDGKIPKIAIHNDSANPPEYGETISFPNFTEEKFAEVFCNLYLDMSKRTGKPIRVRIYDNFYGESDRYKKTADTIINLLSQKGKIEDNSRLPYNMPQNI